MNTVRKITWLLVVALALSLALATGAKPARADINGCPNGGIGNPQTSNRVGATATCPGSGHREPFYLEKGSRHRELFLGIGL